MGSGIWCFTASEESRMDQMEIIGTKGKIQFSAFTPAPIQVETEDGMSEYDLIQPEHVQQPLIQSVVDKLLGRGDCPSTGVSAARTTRVIDQILRDWRAAL